MGVLFNIVIHATIATILKSNAYLIISNRPPDSVKLLSTKPICVISLRTDAVKEFSVQLVERSVWLYAVLKSYLAII